ncbi:MAG: hypothetical protein ACOCW3_02245 [Spirochaetota bacterium]
MTDVRRWLSIVAIACLPITTAAAQYALDVHVVVGFSGVFRAGSWTPVHLTVQNLGDDMDGELHLEIARGSRVETNPATLRYSREVELVSGASKAFSFIVPIETTVYPLRIRIVSGDTTAHEQEQELLGRSVPAKLTLVLARRPNLDFLLPLYNNRDQRGLDIVYPLLAYLPDRWQGYEAVDTIVIHDARLQELTEPQVIAIRDWVASGGRLVVSGGSHFGPADAQTLAPIGEFTTTGIAVTTVDAAGFSEAGLSVDPDEREREVVATTFAGSGTALRRFELGSGDVVVLPVDYANLVRVAPLTSVALWNSLLSGTASQGGVPTELRRRVFESETLANQLSLPLYDFPSRLLVLGLAMSFLIGVGAILVWVARGEGRLRRPIGLSGIVALAAVVAVVGHLSLTVSLQPVEALSISVERADLLAGGGYAVVTRDTALFSRQRADYTVRYDGSPLLIPMEARDHRVVQEPDGTTQRMQIGRWGYENNLAYQVVPLELSFRIEHRAGYAEVEIANDSPQRIEGVVALVNGVPTPLGDLPPGSVSEHVLDGTPEDDLTKIDWERYVPDDRLAANRARLIGDLARRRRVEEEATPEVVVVGWTERPLLPVAVEPTFERAVDLHFVVIGQRREESA